MACFLWSGGHAMRNLVIWNVLVAAVLGGLYGALLHLVFGRGGTGRTALKAIAIILLTGATTPYVAPALRGFAAPILPKSLAERAVESFEARLVAIPEWQERTRGRSRKEMMDIAHDVGFRGVSRLDDASLAAAAGMLAWFLEDLDAPTCGGIVKGTLARDRVSAAFMKRLDTAPPQMLDTWMDVLYAAAIAELTGRQVVAPSSRDTAGALQLLLSRMPPKDADLLRHTLTGLKRADDEHACWAARTMYHYLPQLPDEPRRDLTRALFTS
jgi:hypothetical protein